MTTVFLDAVFKPFLKIVRDTDQQLTIDRTNFLTDGFLQIIQRTWVVSVNTRFQIHPKKKNRTLEDRESDGATARLRNWKWVARETCFEQWSLTRLQCALWHHLVETAHWHSLFVFGAVLSAAQFWVLPIQKMTGFRGSSCISAVSIRNWNEKESKSSRYVHNCISTAEWCSVLDVCVRFVLDDLRWIAGEAPQEMFSEPRHLLPAK